MGNKKRLNLGFTLVELLVVISIISALVTVVAGGFRSSQTRGRDVERKANLKEIANALELYYNDYGQYPDSVTFGTEFTDGKTVYFKELPNDPVSAYVYIYRVVPASDNQKFQLYAYLENTQDKDIITTTQTCGSKPCNFSITSSNTTPSE